MVDELQRLTATLERCKAIAAEMDHPDWCNEHWSNQQENQHRIRGCDCGLWDLLVVLGLRAPEVR